ncbi:MAG: dihydrolipoyl dehydrogenase [Myxococcales bacterium FL481]|nr:MAG: dihydrolipoyl dehydrogenase [Myxococcales bacterium FL481]
MTVPKRELDVDVAIIGAGTAGLNARRAALAAGAKRVVMIEGGPHGTTCARVGCMPSKLLIAAAEAAHEIRHAGVFGVHAPPPQVDGPAVLRRVQSERDRFVGFVLRAVDDLPAEQKLTGYARFVDASTLDVDDHTRVRAKSVVVAAGTEPFVPDGFESLGDRLLTNASVFELPDLPRSLAVLGTGVIGLELGQAMHRLGVDVTIINRSRRAGPARDPEVQAVICEELSRELDLRFDAHELSARRVGDEVELSFVDASGAATTIRVERVLCALGRRPSWERLAADRAGLPGDDSTSVSYDPHTMQVGSGPLFVAGDIVDERGVLHEAADEGRFAGTNAARYPHVRAFDRRAPLTVVFSDPQIATVGVPYDELDFASGQVVHGDVSYVDQGRARVMAKNQGIVRVYGDRLSRRLIAAEMFGPRVEHTAHLLAWAIQQGMSVDAALRMPVYHPVVEEGIRTALRRLAAAME